MKTRIYVASLIAAGGCLLIAPKAEAVTNLFFNASQTASVMSSGTNATTLRSGDYLFTYSVDGYWAVCSGCNPTGRFFSVFWPMGVQAQAITAGPLVGKGANITIQRADGKLFDLRAFTGKLLANTAGTGAAFEVMPQLNGEDALNDSLMFDASGYGGQSFPHTPNLAGYDTYKFHLFVDWALTALTFIDTNTAPPTPPNTITASVSPAGAGTVIGAGDYPSNNTCTLIATANPAWRFQSWTEIGSQVSATASYTFTVQSNRSLVAVFVPLLPLLNIALLSPDTVRLTWPTNSPGFTLQHNTDLKATNWLATTNAANVAGTNYQLVVPVGEQTFFRLKLP